MYISNDVTTFGDDHLLVSGFNQCNECRAILQKIYSDITGILGVKIVI